MRVNLINRINIKKLKLIHTPPRFYPYIGGVENYAYYLCKNLSNYNVDLEIICAREPEKFENKTELCINRLDYLTKISNTNITIKLPFVLWKKDFDVIHTYFPTPWSFDISVIIGKFKHKKIIVTYCNDITGKNLFTNFIAFLYNNTFLRLNLHLVDKIIIIQKDYINYSKYLKRYNSKIMYLPPGIDTKTFSPQKVDYIENSIFFLSVLDSYHKYKGLIYLLEALTKVKKIIPDICLYIGGDGDLLPYYRNKAKELKIEDSVIFIGKIPEKELQRWYNKTSIFVLPSINIQEGFGMVIAEAMSSAKPVIATSQIGLAKDILNTNSGVIVEPRKSDQLSNEIIKLLTNKKLMLEMGNNGCHLIKKKYSWEVISKQIANIYYNL